MPPADSRTLRPFVFPYNPLPFQPHCAPPDLDSDQGARRIVLSSALNVS